MTFSETRPNRKSSGITTTYLLYSLFFGPVLAYPTAYIKKEDRGKEKRISILEFLYRSYYIMSYSVALRGTSPS